MKENHPIYLVVVESHQHALEHIHEILRRRKILPKHWSMVHFDAHPDLACPDKDIPAFAYYQPRKQWVMPKKNGGCAENGNCRQHVNLYEALDLRASGIAEWILPLALSSGLSEVYWIRSKQIDSYQLPLGHFQFHVGCWNPDFGRIATPLESFLDLPDEAELKVDWDCRYYTEDGSHALSHELQLAVPIQLHAVEDLDCLPLPSSSSLWCLDIDLDYFACQNPFFADLERIDPIFTQNLAKAVRSSKFYALSEEKFDFDVKSLRQYRLDIVALFESLHEQEVNSDHDDELHHKIYNLNGYYPSSEEESVVSSWVDLAHRFQSHSPALQKSIITSIRDEVLPHVDLPHMFQAETNIQDQQLQESLVTLEAALTRQPPTHANAPFLVSIARSTADGFTPNAVVEELQSRVLHMIHTRYCGCPAAVDTPASSCDKFVTLFDYGDTEGGSFFDTPNNTAKKVK